jgi:hypothetical protein
MFLSATLFNIDEDIRVDNVTSEELIITTIEDGYFAYTDNEDVIFSGVVTRLDGLYGFYVDEDTIIRLDDGYYIYEDNELVDIKATELQREQSYKIPMAFVISAIGVAIVVLVVMNKMQWYKKYPRLSALVALATGTLILWMIDVLVSNLLFVFLIATISWGAYCIEYLIDKGLIDEETGKKAESETIKALKEALGDG